MNDDIFVDVFDCEPKVCTSAIEEVSGVHTVLENILLLDQVVHVNMALRRCNVSSVASSSPQREPQNTNKLESGTGSQHNTNGYVKLILC